MIQKLQNLRTRLQTLRAQREARQQLARELAAYDTPAQRQELDAIIGRHSEEDTREVQAILNAQATVRMHSTTR